MTGFSPSDAAMAGFRVIGERWRVVVGWSLFNVVALVAMVVLTVIVAFGVAAASSGGAVALSGELGGLVALLGAALTEAVLAAGLFRLMLRPDQPGFLHLRLGADELRILAVWGVMLAGVFLLIGVSAVVVAAGRKLGPLGGVAAWLAVAAGGLWLALRLSLATVTTFAERRITLSASWRLTRGHVWSLLGMAVLSACIVALLAFLFTLALLAVLSLTVGFGSVIDAFNDPEALKSHPGVYLVELAAELALTPVAAVLLLAPWVAAYEALRGEPA
ncbi:MAG: hypothetical protein JWP49_1572 [Phenylobacterium sp.]|jgi:hypothetical protein|nr:hypothetical protein [Phenylobacterium sp.]